MALGDTPPNITWYRDGQKLYNDSRITVYNDTIEQGGLTFTHSVLELCSAEPLDEGEYTCVAVAARNDDAYSTATFTVDIVEPQGMYIHVLDCIAQSVDCAGPLNAWSTQNSGDEPSPF